MLLIDISLYIKGVFRFSLIRTLVAMATNSFHIKLLMGKVERGNVSLKIFEYLELLIKQPSPFQNIFVQAAVFDYQGDTKGNFS